MGIFSKLAKDTAIYGSTLILARVLNYLFLPIYTRILGTAEFGIYSEIMGYIAFLQILLTFGLETGFFRFANRSDQNPSLVFSTVFRFLFTTSLVFFVGVTFFSQSIADLMGYYRIAVIYSIAILAIDSFTAVLFAKLRFENKPLKFGVFKMIKVLSESAFNLILLFFVPKYLANNPDSILLNFLSPTPDYTYILAAIFGSCIISVLLFIPDFFSMSFKFSIKTLKSVLIYSLPLMVAGFPGIANDVIDRLLFRFFAPDTAPWDEQLGIFSANVKLAIFIVLFIQMFRYAAEPFFFSSSNQPNIKKVYADVMKYFTAFCMLIFMFITMYIDLFGLMLGKDFRSGIVVVPIMLLANVLLGINQNLSMWYKLCERTKSAIFITIIGLSATLLVNILFMPRFGAYAAAWGHLISYTVMIIVSYRMSIKYYHIPYEWGRLGVFIGSGVLLYLISLLFNGMPLIVKLSLNTVLLLVYFFFLLKIERINPVLILIRIREKVGKRSE